MHLTLKQEMARNISSGLSRRSVTSCSRWAEKYRMMGTPFEGPWTFKYHPWLLAMHDAECDKIIGQKAAQMGYTEWAMNVTFYTMDVKSLDVLYILPTSDDAGDFSAGRFDPALELSPHLRGFFSDVNNVRLKRAGSNMLYVRGSHSRSKLKSIPCPLIVFDEADEMPESSVALAEERQSGQIVTIILMLSTPTIEGFGINGEYKLTTQETYHFKCPGCSRLTELIFPECLEITGESLTDPNLKNSRLRCKECDVTLHHEDKPNFLAPVEKGGTGQFVPEYTDRDARGFHVSQLYSSAKAGMPHRLAEAKLKADRDPTRAQEFFNSKLGLCFEVDGARVTQKQIADAIGGYHSGPVRKNDVFITQGIDVGAVLHVVIKEFSVGMLEWRPGIAINDYCDARILYEGTTSGTVVKGESDFNEAYQMFMDYGCSGGVVDAEPERREALRFAQRLWGQIFLCDYLFSQTGREVTIDKNSALIKVNRTAWMDLSLGRYRNGTVQLPVETSLDFKKQIREPVRVYKEDKWGNKYGVYESVGPDHFAHSDTYAEIALPLAASFARNQDIMEMY